MHAGEFTTFSVQEINTMKSKFFAGTLFHRVIRNDDRCFNETPPIENKYDYYVIS
jgi:hypothetical protein